MELSLKVNFKRLFGMLLMIPAYLIALGIIGAILFMVGYLGFSIMTDYTYLCIVVGVIVAAGCFAIISKIAIGMEDKGRGLIEKADRQDIKNNKKED